MEINSYLNKMQNIQRNLLNFIDDENSSHFDFHIFSILFKDLNSEQKYDMIIETLHIISKIACNHHRTSNFFNKIEDILIYFSIDIQQTFTSHEIYQIFEKNYRILLFLFKENIIKFNEVANSIFPDYFLFEKLSYLNEGHLSIDELNEPGYKNYEEKRKIGENESNICSLIRNDSVEEFVKYANKNNISLTSKINESIFETNCYLKRHTPTLIEYAAFFGSIQIFQYLQINKVNLTSSLWIYAIHSNNPELIHIIENNHIEPPDNSYVKCLKESIKCHHNEIANYIIDNYLNEKIDFSKYCIKYFNFSLLQNNFYNNENVILFIKFGYISIPKMFYNGEIIDINENIEIFNLIDFNDILILFIK